MSSIIPSLLREFRAFRTERLRMLREKTPLLRDPSAASDTSQNLCSLLLELHSYTGTLDCLQEAILLYRQLLGGPLDKHHRIVFLNGLADALYFAWEHSTRLATLDEAATLHRQALQLCRESDKNPLESILGLVRVLIAARDPLFNDHIDLQDDPDALLLEARSLDAGFPRGNPLVTLLSADFMRVKSTASPTAVVSGLDIPLDWCLQALDAPEITHFPELWRLLFVMGSLACTRYNMSGNGDAAYLRESLEYFRYAADANHAPEHPGYWITLGRLAGRVFDLYVLQDDVAFLHESLALARKAVAACPTYAPSCRGCISTILQILRVQDIKSRSLDSVTEAITILQSVETHQLVFKMSLAEWLQTRWEHTGDPSDLSESISVLEKLLAAAPPPDAINLAVIHFYLACGLVECYRDQRSSGILPDRDLEAALRHNEIALKSFLKTPHMASGYLYATQNNLAECIYEWMLVSGDLRRIREALDLAREALAWSSKRPGMSLAVSSAITMHGLLRIRYERFAESRNQDILEIMQLHKRALELTPPGSPRRSNTLYEIAMTYLSVYARTGNNVKDVMLARQSFSLAASDNAASAYARLPHAIRWLAKAQSDTPHVELLDEFLVAFDILSQVATLGMASASRLAALRQSRGLAVDGALHALSHKRLHAALTMLEQGRNVFWQRTLHLRTPFDDLPTDLRENLKAVGTMLNDEGRVSDAQRRLELGVQFDDLLRQARTCSGQEHLLAGLPYEELQKSTKGGPVVVLITGKAGSEVIIIASEKHPPEKLSLDVTLDRVRAWETKLRTSNVIARDRLTREDRKIITKKRPVPYDRPSSDEVLADIWTTMVSPVVQRLDLTKSSNGPRPRIWLCPVGILAFIPFHAAGIHTGPEAVCLQDFAICSYTPTLTALINARSANEHTISPHPDPALLVVATPQADNFPTLPNVLDEVEHIKAIAGAHRLLDCGPSGNYTVQGILESLPQASILHMACHGEQHRDNALETGFYIGRQKLTIADIMRVKLPVARLAVLSACETAKGDTTQPDEAIHLAAAMLFAGFPSVIATMWSMNDADGPDVAKIVYEQVFEGGEFKPEVAPYALDAAVRQLREAGVHPSRWATYIHMGV